MKAKYARIIRDGILASRNSEASTPLYQSLAMRNRSLWDRAWWRTMYARAQRIIKEVHEWRDGR